MSSNWNSLLLVLIQKGWQAVLVQHFLTFSCRALKIRTYEEKEAGDYWKTTLETNGILTLAFTCNATIVVISDRLNLANLSYV